MDSRGLIDKKNDEDYIDYIVKKEIDLIELSSSLRDTDNLDFKWFSEQAVELIALRIKTTLATLASLKRTLWLDWKNAVTVVQFNKVDLNANQLSV